MLYDDACGFCRSRIPFWSGTLAKRGLRPILKQIPRLATELGLTEAKYEEQM